MLENIETEADIFCKEHSLNNGEKKWIDLFVNKLKKQIIQQKNSGGEDNNAEISGKEKMHE